MSLKKKKKLEFQTIVVGDNLCAWLLAQHHSQKTSTALISHKPFNPTKASFYEIDIIPCHKDNLESIAWMEQLLNNNSLLQKPLQQPPLIIESGNPVSLSHFQKRNAPSLEVFDFFLHSQCLRAPSAEHWMQKIKESFQGQTLCGVEVTDIQVENNRIKGLVLNGDSLACAQDFIFCTSPDWLAKKLPHTAINKAWQKKLHRPRHWTALQLQLLHKDFSTEFKNQLHILYNKTSPKKLKPNAPSYVIGTFSENSEKSFWQSLIPSDEIRNTDLMGQAISLIKQQLKKFYPKLLQKVELEKIILSTEHYGSNLKKWPPFKEFSNLSGLTLSSPLCSSKQGLLAQLDLTRDTLFMQDCPQTPRQIASPPPSTI